MTPSETSKPANMNEECLLAYLVQPTSAGSNSASLPAQSEVPAIKTATKPRLSGRKPGVISSQSAQNGMSFDFGA